MKLEVGSPRAFLCEDPRFLTRPISMRGHPKLWQLPPQILSRAAACLQLPPQVMHISVRLSHTSVHTYLVLCCAPPNCAAIPCTAAASAETHQDHMLPVQLRSTCGIQHSCTNLAATPCLPCEGWGICEWKSAKP